MDRFDGGFDRAESRHHDDRQGRILFVHDPSRFQTAHARHAHIDDQQIVGCVFQARKRRVTGDDLLNTESLRFQRLGEKLTTDFVVIGDQDVGAHHFPR